MILMKDIIREGHPTLREKAREVHFPLNDADRQLCLDLAEYLQNSNDETLADKYELRAGVGLAAPQVNASKRIFAVDLSDEQDRPIQFVAINPKIISHSVEKTYLDSGEGCLSVDRVVEGYVPRYKRITLQAFDLNGEPFKKRLTGLAAIVVQHELDHLNGIMFYDHINKQNPFQEIENATPYERS